MDLHKLVHEACEASRHLHLPLFAGLIGSIKLQSKIEFKDNYSGFGETPGDNFPVFQKRFIYDH